MLGRGVIVLPAVVKKPARAPAAWGDGGSGLGRVGAAVVGFAAPAAGAAPVAAGVVDHLVQAAVGESRELDLHHRPQTLGGEAESTDDIEFAPVDAGFADGPPDAWEN